MMIPLVLVACLPTIWIVDSANGPGASFTDLPAAVAAAASGDTLVVRAGAYTPFMVSGKALTILGSGAAVTHVWNPTPIGSTYAETRIDGVPQGAVFYVSGIHFAPISFPPFPQTPSIAGLKLSGPGVVVLSDAVIQGASFSGMDGNHGLDILGGAEVHVSRCTVGGGGGNLMAGGAGARVGSGCTLAADATLFTGGTSTAIIQFSPGGAGLDVQGGTATLTRSSCAGNVGGFSSGPGVNVAGGGFVRAAGTAADVFQGGWSPNPVLGGAAIRAVGTASAILHGNITLNAGTAAVASVIGTVTTGAVSLPYLSLTGTLSSSGDLDATFPVTLTLEGGTPSVPFAFILDLAPAFSTGFAPLLVGELLVSIPPGVVIEGMLDGSGMSQTTVFPAVTAPALVGVPFYAQFGVLVAPSVLVSNGLVRRIN